MNPATTTPAESPPPVATPTPAALPWQPTDEDLTILRSHLPESARAQEADCLAWWRELPRLVAEGEENRFALVREGRVVSVWDTYGDAIQAGYDKFGDRPFLTPKITRQELERLQVFLAHEKAKRYPR
jgi:hypothetical protein